MHTEPQPLLQLDPALLSPDETGPVGVPQPDESDYLHQDGRSVLGVEELQAHIARYPEKYPEALDPHMRRQGLSVVRPNAGAETAERGEVVVSSYDLRKRLYVKDELRPLATERFVAANGDARDLPVLAVFGTHDSNTPILFTGSTQATEHAPASGPMFIHAQRAPDGTMQVLRYQALEFGKDSHQTVTIIDDEGRYEQSVFVTKGDASANYAWELAGQCIDHNAQRTVPVTVQVGADQQVSRHGKAGWEKSGQRRRFGETLNRAKRLLIGAVILKATLDSGGLIDQVGEKFDDASVAVYESVDMPEHRVLTMDDTWGDGIPYSQAKPGRLEEDQSRQDATYATNLAARDTVAGLMDELDTHDYALINTQAEAFKAAHAEEFLPQDKVDEYLQRIEGAATSQEAVNAFGDFLSFYGITAGLQTEVASLSRAFSPDEEIEGVKAAANMMVTNLAPWPKSLITSTKIQKIDISGSGVSKEDGVIGGYYDYETNVLTMPYSSTSVAKQAFVEVGGYLSAVDADQSRLFVHELGHALTAHNTVRLVPVPAGLQAKQTAPTVFEHAFWAGVVKYPDSATPFARKDAIERTAEDVAGVLAQNDWGLAHPDEWRRYNSPANKEMLRVLYDFERYSPGLASYIIAQNKRLMQGQGTAMTQG